MSAIEIGKQLVNLCQNGRGMEAVETLYGDGIVSIEAQEMEGMPARMEGLEAIKGKNQWWYDNHEVHSAKAEGPFCGHRADQFGVLFEYDVTNKPSGQRSTMSEVALYTVAGGKIVQEEFMYLMNE